MLTLIDTLVAFAPAAIAIMVLILLVISLCAGMPSSKPRHKPPNTGYGYTKVTSASDSSVSGFGTGFVLGSLLNSGHHSHPAPSVSVYTPTSDDDCKTDGGLDGGDGGCGDSGSSD